MLLAYHLMCALNDYSPEVEDTCVSFRNLVAAEASASALQQVPCISHRARGLIPIVAPTKALFL